MVLQPDPSGEARLLGDSTSEFVFVTAQQAADFPLGVLLLEGDDTAYGAAFADDLIIGNQGEDVIYGSGGQDSLFGGQDRDFINGNQGDDVVFGNIDNDLLNGNEGDDLMFGGQGNDIIYAQSGNDTLSGDRGRDVLLGPDSLVPDMSNRLYILETESNAQNVDDADLIIGFLTDFDQLGLTGGLTENDLILEAAQEVPVSVNIELSTILRDYYESIGSLPFLTGEPFLRSGTIIRAESTGNVIAFVQGVTPEDLQGSFISVDGF
ncbi:calcium-binding protein [Limnoraphis robusta]|uniref:Calcium-binding protein n=1 Tax=Limnoraphis robusta CCNP1315 TaxID=3110306 RepID=A0ABU5U776_9CYAN|nr:calcium-binding protein [Limnoraphis robusta]MEA5523029.1 calcium-binding protein [Limnoraphis robusta CCNP1315]MEA5546895.1 calcium-binding protein [Limnoraphis robusta CCNP1324]